MNMVLRFGNKKYEHGLKVWYKFEMKATKGYYSLYLYCDILLLADVFETFVFVFFELTSFNLE